MQGESIAAPPLQYETGGGGTGNVCTVNAAGAASGAFMASTFSLPEEVKKGGSKAIYTCPGGSQGGYAQCEGGLCFTSTTNNAFPGVGKIAEGEILCACPVFMAIPTYAQFGWQFIAEYPCNRRNFRYCDLDPRNGDIIPVGAPPGAGRVLTGLLYGQQYPLNQCFYE
jgi:hypothetical protein